jgi:hypothetical protein
MAPPNEDESWFDTAPKYSVPPQSLVPPPAPTTRPLLTSLIGAGTGLVASVLAGFVATIVATQMGTHLVLSLQTEIIGAGVGAVLGVMLGLVMMQSEKFVVRAIFASIVSVAAWFCAHIAMMVRHAQTLPLVPMLVGACIFGVCIACIPPLKKKVPPK